MLKLTSFFGLLAIMFLAWLLSKHKRKIPWRVIVGGTLLQFAFAGLVLETKAGEWVFGLAQDAFVAVVECTRAGTKFVLGDLWFKEPYVAKSFVLTAVPTIVFFSALMSILYYYGVMQKVVRAIAFVMRWTLGTSAAETLSAAANIFLGQTEAPLMIRPYLASMTLSELMCVMVAGFGTVAGGVLAAYVDMGVSARHLLAASFISAPACVLMAKIMQPEVDKPKTLGTVAVDAPIEAVNVIHAAAIGAADGAKLAINVVAMLIAFLALIELGELIVHQAGLLAGRPFGLQWDWSLKAAFGYVFSPLAWLMGVEPGECLQVGRLLGLKTIANEFIAYEELTKMKLSPRSTILATYALCGFANIGSIGIQIGGIGPLAPERRADLARLGLRAMLAGMLANCMTACVVGVFI
ncbi:MAG: NupC/NupG family nucleoside CNT transporter [Planctomycetia bacterium]|nr:NupC/NupG family nucleoside CNT transporter [Planctomycetia bacterium]